MNKTNIFQDIVFMLCSFIFVIFMAFLFILGFTLFTLQVFALQGGSANSYSTTAPEYKFFHQYNFTGETSDIPNDENGIIVTEANTAQAGGTKNFSISTNRLSFQSDNNDASSATKLCNRLNEERVNFTCEIYINFSGTMVDADSDWFNLYLDNSTACGTGGAGIENALIQVGRETGGMHVRDGSFPLGPSAIERNTNINVGFNHSIKITNMYKNTTSCSYNMSVYRVINNSVTGNLSYIENGSMLEHSCGGGGTGVRNIFPRMGGDSNRPAGTFAVGIDEFVCWNGTGARPVVTVAPDLTPPEITLINLTSEGGLGQIVFENGVSNNKLTPPFRKTNDTTPTFFAKTDTASSCAVINLGRDLNYSDITAGSAECATTGALVHTCTLPDNNRTSIGMRNFSIGCRDLETQENQNRTSTSGNFTINITDFTPPNVTLYKPKNGDVFQVGVNNTNILFNWSVTDNFDTSIPNCSVYLNTTLLTNSTNQANNTHSNKSITLTDIGDFSYYANCTDSYNNRNGSQVFTITINPQIFIVNLTLFLNGSNESRKYEFDTLLLDKDYGVEINITTQPIANWSLDYDYFINWTKGQGNTSIRFNVSELNITRLVNGNTSFNLTSKFENISIKVDNNTDLVKVGFKLRGYSLSGIFPYNLTIDFDRDSISDVIIPGLIRDNKVVVSEFKTSSANQLKSGNITFITSGTSVITLNASSLLNIKNFSMRLSGYDLDSQNEFNIADYLNKTSVKNETLSYKIDSPMGVFEDFKTNRSIWTSTGTECRLNYLDDGYVGSDEYLRLIANPSCITNYNNPAGDLRNTSQVNIVATLGFTGACESSFIVYATDGTSSVFLGQVTQIANPDGLGVTMIIEKISSNYQTYHFVTNSSLGSNSEITLSTLDFTKQIKLRFDWISCGGYALFQNINWSGVWLNRTTVNGTYVGDGNFTSRVVNVTKTNVTKATLTAYDYTPSGTRIDYYLSNTCNATNPTFESVTNKITHTFSSTGNTICWRANLNSSRNDTTPIIRKMEVSVVKSSAKNISVDSGSDGDTDWNFEDVLNSTTSPRIVNVSLDDFTTYKSKNCNYTTTCQYPLSISIKTAGVLSIDEINLTQRIINEDNTTGEINLTNLTILDRITNWNWTVNFINGVIGFYDLDVEFYGSQNKTLLLNLYENATATLMANTTRNLTLQIYHSKFNASFPRGISYYNVFPASKDSKNVTPFKQENRTPIWNITTFAYDRGLDIYARLNNSINCTTGNQGGANVTYSNSTSKDDGVILNTSLKFMLTNISKEPFTLTQTNQTINITLNGSTSNSTFIRIDIIDEQFGIRNNTNESFIIKRNIDYKINFTTGNLTLLNNTYNMTNLFVSYNYSKATPSKGLWNFWDFTNCTRRFIIPRVIFQSYCEGCVV